MTRSIEEIITQAKPVKEFSFSIFEHQIRDEKILILEFETFEGQKYWMHFKQSDTFFRTFAKQVFALYQEWREKEGMNFVVYYKDGKREEFYNTTQERVIKILKRRYGSLWKVKVKLIVRVDE